jgi:hypothetical protein
VSIVGVEYGSSAATAARVAAREDSCEGARPYFERPVRARAVEASPGEVRITLALVAACVSSVGTSGG